MDVLLLAGLFCALPVAAAAIDALLHRADAGSLGRWLGLPGTLLILFSFVYSLRKRGFLRKGSLTGLLRLHEAMAWTGSLLVLVHAGVHLNAVLPWLALLALWINLVSGLTGKYILRRSQDGAGEEPGLDRARWSHWMNRWREIHVPLALTLAGLTALHVLTILMYRVPG